MHTQYTQNIYPKYDLTSFDGIRFVGDKRLPLSDNGSTVLGKLVTGLSDPIWLIPSKLRVSHRKNLIGGVAFPKTNHVFNRGGVTTGLPDRLRQTFRGNYVTIRWLHSGAD